MLVIELINSGCLKIGNKTFEIGKLAVTSRGIGKIVGLEPFSDTEIAVLLIVPKGAIHWFAYTDVTMVPEEVADAHNS